MTAHLPNPRMAADLAIFERITQTHRQMDRLTSTPTERRAESGWTIFGALILALALLSARVAGFAP